MSNFTIWMPCGRFRIPAEGSEVIDLIHGNRTIANLVISVVSMAGGQLPELKPSKFLLTSFPDGANMPANEAHI